MAPPTPSSWWVIGFFAASPESVSQDINGEPPTSTQILHGTSAQATQAASFAVNGKAFGPYSSQSAAQSAINSGKIAGNQPLGNFGIKNPLTGINAIGDFFQRLTQGATWVRVGEVTVGGILLVIGINYMTGGKATKAAKTVAKTGMFL